MSTIPSGVRAAYRPGEFAALTGLTRQTVHALIAKGEVRSVKLGRSRLIPATELDRFFGDGTAAFVETGGDAA